MIKKKIMCFSYLFTCTETEQCSEIVLKNYKEVQCKRTGKFYCMKRNKYYCKKHLPFDEKVKFVGKKRKRDSDISIMDSI